MGRVPIAEPDVGPGAALAGLLRDDVDDAVERVGTVEGGAGATHDLDPLDVLDADGERPPQGGAHEIEKNAAAVDQDEHLVRKTAD